MGVVTGIPMEFQFGTNWARFAEAAGGVIGQTLAMEGVFAFFLESLLPGAVLFWEDRLGPEAATSLAAVCRCSSARGLSGFFIVATNAWMQHPVGYGVGRDGRCARQPGTLLGNPWLDLAVHPHHGSAPWSPGCFAMAAHRRLYLLSAATREPYGRAFVRLGGDRGRSWPRWPHADRLSHRRHAGSAGGAAPAGRRSPPWRGYSTPSEARARPDRPARHGAHGSWTTPWRCPRR